MIALTKSVKWLQPKQSSNNARIIMYLVASQPATDSQLITVIRVQVKYTS